MIGFVYLVLCFMVGGVICTYAFPELGRLVEKDYEKSNIRISPYLLIIPAWYLTGTIAVTWATYLVALAFGKEAEPLFYANLIVMPIAAIAVMLAGYLQFRKSNQNFQALVCKERRIIQWELVLISAITILAVILMWTTFFVIGDKAYIGVTVFSDFSPHIGMIRSFSYGNNFPTAYSHFAGEDIKYHFMFQFLVGNLEYLGMRLDYAFNLPSIFSFIFAFVLLYVLAVKMTGNMSVGFLACLFFAFRSAKTLFTYLSEIPLGTSVIRTLVENYNFISDTPNEDWGLWNLNVYCNQRHLAFGLAVSFLVIIMLLPHLYDAFEHLNRFNIKDVFFTKEAWLVQDLRRAIALGILLGSLAFFHGAAVIGCLSILFLIAILSKRRFEFLIVAVITLTLSYAQTHLFIDGSAVATKYFFGFIAENKTFFGVASYLERLLGILPFVLLAAFCLEKGVGRYLILAFTAPLIFAFTVSLTVDVTVNHKYIMMSCILLGIFASSIIMKLFARKDFLLKLVGIFLIISLTATGVYDFITILKKNAPASAIILNLDDPLTKWVDDNSDSKDIFLTSNYAINQIVLGGAMLYEGWPYFPWSAGYNTDFRTQQVKEMYEADTPTELDTLVKKNHIRFIVVDRDNIVSEEYILNEENIKDTYYCVYSIGEGEGRTAIYDTQKPIY